MDFHGLNTKGKIWIERLSTLPTWTANDIGRMVYITGTDKYYKGDATGWSLFERAANLFAGFLVRPKFEWNNTSSIIINPGRYHHSGTAEQFLKWSTPITYTFAGLGSFSNYWQYLYIWDGALTSDTLSSSTLRNNIIPPTWNSTKSGWYNKEDRCIFAVYVDGSSQIVKFFHLNDYIRWDYRYEPYRASTVTASWQPLCTFRAPSFCTQVGAAFHAENVSQWSWIWYRPEGATTNTGIPIAQHYHTNHRYQRSTDEKTRVQINSSTKRIDMKVTYGTGGGVRIMQTGWWLPDGM